MNYIDYMNKQKKIIGERIKTVRKELKELYKSDAKGQYRKYEFCNTQRDFARHFNISDRTLSKWEQGTDFPPLEVLYSMSLETDHEISYYLGLDIFPFLSSIKDASYITKIDSSIIKQCINDPEYRDFINYFMLPRNCFNLITILNASATHEFMALESIFGLCDTNNQLYQIIKSKFTTYYFISPLEKMSGKDFKEYLLLELKSDMFNFDPTISSYKKINIYECLTADMCTKFKNSITTLTSADEIFKMFISYIANITYEPLYKCELDKINRTKVASEFNKLIFQYLDT